MDFKKLKKSAGDLEKLAQKAEEMNAKSSFKKDERLWYPEIDKAGNGFAVIRFLPAPPVDGDDALPFVRVFNHGFQGPSGLWYIENSLTTLGKDHKDPCGEYNSMLWAKSSDDESPERTQARAQKRRLNIYSNIFIIDDPKHPENNGTVRIFKYGKKIWDKINEAMHPQFEDEKPFNPFDFWTGKNFKLKIRTVDKRVNYDKSEFDKDTVWEKTDKELEEIYNSEFSLKEFVSPDKFKTYDQLKARLELVLQLNGPTFGKAKTLEERVNDEVEEYVASPDIEEEDEEGMEFFKSLAKKD